MSPQEDCCEEKSTIKEEFGRAEATEENDFGGEYQSS
jgi:hypothetical protein